MPIDFSISHFSIPGPSKVNEDAHDFFELSDRGIVAAIADGVGGNYGGGIASALAIQTSIFELQKNPETSFSDIFSAVALSMKEKSKEDLISSNMATTLTICKIQQNGLVHIGHTGDTRVYHLRSNGIIQKTKDQTEVAALVEAGILSKTQAQRYPRRSVLRSAMGANIQYDLFQTNFQMNRGDRLILVTDGIYRTLNKTQIRDLSVESSSTEDLSSKMIARLTDSNEDDATAVIIEYSYIAAP